VKKKKKESFGGREMHRPKCSTSWTSPGSNTLMHLWVDDRGELRLWKVLIKYLEFKNRKIVG